MRITALDIRTHVFPRTIGGYARDEVDAFLDMISDDYEALLRETQALRENVIRLEVQVERLSSNEAILQETLTTAQQLSQDLKQTAVKEAETVIGEAEVKAEKVLDAAHRRATRLAIDLREMKELRTRLAASVRATIDTHPDCWMRSRRTLLMNPRSAGAPRFSREVAPTRARTRERGPRRLRARANRIRRRFLDPRIAPLTPAEGRRHSR